MYFYRISLSDPSKFEGLHGKLFTTAHDAKVFLVNRFGFQDSLIFGGYHHPDVVCNAYIKKVSIKLPDTIKSDAYDSAKSNADRLISTLNSTLLIRGVSQDEFARIAHIDSGNLSKILSGVIYPNLKTWCRLVFARFQLDFLARKVIENGLE